MEAEPLDDDQLTRIFFPFAAAELDRVREQNKRFVHYTSAEAALAIIKSREIWLRNSHLMNDFSEVEHGRRCLAESWHDPVVGSRFKQLLDSIKPALSQEVSRRFDERDHLIRTETYLLSISEHDDDEDQLGRLSMWRAYGGSSGVAFVFNSQAFTSESSALDAYVMPVFYSDPEGFKTYFTNLTNSLDHNIALLKTIDPDLIANMAVAALYFIVLSTKHPGFREEREWRAIFSPVKFDGETANLERIMPALQCVRGVPQRIYRVPFKNYPQEGMTMATLPEILDRLIIGPSPYGYPTASALHLALEEAGVSDAGQKISISGIPLRT